MLSAQLSIARVSLDWLSIVKVGAGVVIFLVVLLMPTPGGLSPEGQKALAVMTLAVVFWATEALPISVTGLLGVLLLVVVGAVPGITEGLYGFSQPVSYFLIGILTIGLAVQRSGLAERVATFLIKGAGSKPGLLYVQMLFSFALLTFALPSASTRGAIMVHIYAQVLARWGIPQEHKYYRALMMALGTMNRLGSTALLAGGITPVVASALLGDFSWTGWFLLMSVPFYCNLAVGGVILFLLYRSGFRLDVSESAIDLDTTPVKSVEYRAGAIVLVTAMLWFTDFAHGLHPAVPALVAMVLILMPRIGLLTWQDFERNLGWANFFVIATSLSLAHTLVVTGAAGWFSETLVSGTAAVQDSPLLILLVLAVSAAVVRLLMPNIAGYLAFVIPVAMASGEALGLNPLVCGMAVVVVGDSLVYYSAAGTASIFIFLQANIRNPEIFRWALVMTAVAIAVLFLVAVPYWSLLGEPLVP
ncbi:MAG: SLC13 family permease [Chloroflexota bacterium]|nr:SLC13 family permease [Chloroflexota bacterium]